MGNYGTMDETPNTSNTFNNVDDALNYVGSHGRFQAILVAVLGIAMIPMILPVLMMYFAALNPPWKCVGNSSICLLNGTMTSYNRERCSMPRGEWEYTESRDYSIITQFDIYCEQEWKIHLTTSVLFIGWGVGSFVLGWIADNYGRRIAMIPSTFIIIIVGLLISFSPNVAVFTVGRFIIGFFIPATTYQSFVCISEFVTNKYRPIAVAIVTCCMPVAFCILGIKAYFIREWRTLMIVCSAPYFTIIALILFVPESIHWLYVHERKDQLMKIFRRIGYWNEKPIPSNFLLLFQSTALSTHKTNISDLFQSLKLLMKSTSLGFAWLIFGMILYGLTMAADDLGGSLYLNYLLLIIVQFPAYICSAYICELFGRKTTVIAFNIIGSLCCIAIAFSPSVGALRIARITFGVFGKLFMMVSFSGLIIWSLELYPTNTRAQAMGLFQFTSRLGAATAPWIAKGLQSFHHTVPFLIMGGVSLIAGGFLFNLPETKGMPTMETNSDAQVIERVELPVSISESISCKDEGSTVIINKNSPPVCTNV